MGTAIQFWQILIHFSHHKFPSNAALVGATYRTVGRFLSVESLEHLVVALTVPSGCALSPESRYVTYCAVAVRAGLRLLSQDNGDRSVGACTEVGVAEGSWIAYYRAVGPGACLEPGRLAKAS